MKKINYKNYLIILLTLISFSVFAQDNNDTSVPVDRSYVIGPGDFLKISVWKEEGMELEVLVRPDGGITFPLAGEIQAGGLTTKALSDELVKKLKRYIPNPSVTVSVLKNHPCN